MPAAIENPNSGMSYHNWGRFAIRSVYSPTSVGAGIWTIELIVAENYKISKQTGEHNVFMYWNLFYLLVWMGIGT